MELEIQLLCYFMERKSPWVPALSKTGEPLWKWPASPVWKVQSGANLGLPAGCATHVSCYSEWAGH